MKLTRCIDFPNKMTIIFVPSIFSVCLFTRVIKKENSERVGREIARYK